MLLRPLKVPNYTHMNIKLYHYDYQYTNIKLHHFTTLCVPYKNIGRPAPCQWKQLQMEHLLL